MRLLRDSLWGLVGSVGPALLSIISAGLIARALGSEQFGLFLLLCALLACANMLDGGVIRALTRQAAKATGHPRALGQILGTGLLILLALALLGLATVALWRRELLLLLNPSDLFRQELTAALPPLGLLALLQLLTLAVYGMLEGVQQHRVLALLRLASGALAAALPAAHLLLVEAPTLGSVLLSLLLARSVGLVIVLTSALRKLAIRPAWLVWHGSVAVGLWAFGGWVALSNLISPAMNFMDRFMLSSVLGSRQAAAYLASAEVVARMGMVPTALCAPLFAGLCRNPQDKLLHRRARQWMAGVCGLLSCLMFIGAEQVMRLWLGTACDPDSIDVLRLLLIGFWFNALAHVPFARLQALGHSRLTAMLHLVEVLPFVLLLYTLVQSHGALGAANAWVVRMGVDLLAMCLLDYWKTRTAAAGVDKAAAC